MPHSNSKKSNMNRRHFLKASLTGATLTGLMTQPSYGFFDFNTVLEWAGIGGKGINNVNGIKQPLAIPPLLEKNANNQIVLVAQKGETAFVKGNSLETWGYNGSHLGPTIRVKRGDQLNFDVSNQDIPEPISTHWHGLHVPGVDDGTGYQSIPMGTHWQPEINIVQQASTNWYHSHIHGRTSEHVYKGLVGMFIVEDDNSETLSLPKTYGVDDIPIMVQDKQFNPDGTLAPPQGGRFLGNTILVNGTLNPVLEVPQKQVRLRLLNGSNARYYNFRLSDKTNFNKIATEGGFLNAPVIMKAIPMSPGERDEIIIDFSQYELGQTLNLISDDIEGDSGGLFDIIQFKVVADTIGDAPLPKVMNSVPNPNDFDALAWHSFALGNGAVRVDNGKASPFEMARNDLFVPIHQYQKWTVSGDHHPFHVHGCSFLILSVGGKAPAPQDAGWKDTVAVEENQPVEFIVRFEHQATPTARYMYHCHILGHEDQGMMGQFEVG